MRASLVLGLLLAVASSALADRSERHYAKACGLTGTESSVVVDVYDDDSLVTPTPILATIPNLDILRIGSTDCYRVDLANTSASIGFPLPGDAIERHYTLVFRDDAANETKTSETIVGVVGPSRLSFICAREAPVYATQAVPGRGITDSMVARNAVSHTKIEVDCTRAFTPLSITHSYFTVFRYDAKGRVIERAPSDVEPNPF